VRAALVLVAACASAAPSVRGIDGRPLPTSARIDADASVEVTCGAQRYWIVPPPPPYVAGLHVQTERPYVHDLPALCARILAAD
jgi:hypothetical protein